MGPDIDQLSSVGQNEHLTGVDKVASQIVERNYLGITPAVAELSLSDSPERIACYYGVGSGAYGSIEVGSGSNSADILIDRGLFALFNSGGGGKLGIGNDILADNGGLDNKSILRIGPGKPLPYGGLYCCHGSRKVCIERTG